MKKRLVTSALPYVNNIPHLGNLIQVLSADVFARYCRLAGYETLYICGTDEYGTATETRAREEGISPKELCSRYYAIHKDIYDWFHIGFDRFGRTTTEEQTEIVQGLFHKLDQAGYINEAETEQYYCSSCDRFLADRYVRGGCPHCGYAEARGDQCESCGKLLEPTDLEDPRCSSCGNTPEIKKTRHLYLDLPAIRPKLEAWINEASVKGFWSRNAIQMTRSWIRDGLKERCITRDLKWGIPVPKPGYEEKVFYVWFDAPIGYISITAGHTDRWKEDWWQNPEEVELFQFIGKDNIPFHTVIFPSSLLGSGENWTLLHHMSSTEYLNYESGKFSKSKGVGVFGNDCRDTGIPADVWRFYIFYNRPEKSDAVFTWADFQEKINGELIGNLSNLVNRTLSFTHRFFGGEVKGDCRDEAFWSEAAAREKVIRDHYERAELRDAFRQTLELASLGNKVFQEGEPWKTRKTDPAAAQALLSNLIYLIRDLAVLISPVMPETSRRLAGMLGLEELAVSQLGATGGIESIGKPEILFQKLEDEQIEALRKRFSGSQAEREAEREAERNAERNAGEAGFGEKKREKEEIGMEARNNPADELSTEEKFRQKVDLRAAEITKIERHPEADKLYVETLDAGEAEPRTIVSGLVPYYSEEELLGKKIVLVSNLKPAKLRGVKSQGMLLAAESGEGEDQVVDVLFVDAEPGTRLVLQGDDPDSLGAAKKMSANSFFKIPLTVKNGTVMVGETPLVCSGKPVKTAKVADGGVG